jgi:putative phosphonate metabolism protein
MTRDVRYAIYFAPRRTEALHEFGCGVLGRSTDPEREVPLHAPLERFDGNWRERVRSATHYGFHATLKAPFRLVAGVDDQRLREDVASLAQSLPAVPVGHLCVAAMGSFIALVPVVRSDWLQDMAAKVVQFLDHLRVPLTAEDRVRRKPETLSKRQQQLLDQWGYPFVMDAFRFHMTLTGPLLPADQAAAVAILSRVYKPFDLPIVIADLCIFSQADATQPFKLEARIPLADGAFATQASVTQMK